MAELARRSLLFSTCSLLMSALFAYSASVQRDDPDWYLWLPLYSAASAVNLLQMGTTTRPFRTAARAALFVGAALFFKVVIEGYYVHGAAGFFSLDLRERIVREKLGSGLVALSMILHLETAPSVSGEKPRLKSFVDFGMATVVAVSVGLCIRFFVFHQPELRK